MSTITVSGQIDQGTITVSGQLAGVTTTAFSASTLQTWAENLRDATTPAPTVSGATDTDYTAMRHRKATVTWPNGGAGHIDAVLTSAGALRHFTASYVNGSTVMIVNCPAAGSAAAVTPDWFVDASADAGGDGSAAAPFDALADLTLSAGEVVAIRSGGTYREELSLPANASVYRYGTGPRPVITAADVISATWVNDATGSGNSWYVDVTPTTPGITDINTVVWEDGSYLTRASSVANCDATAGSYYVDNDTAATQRIHVHPTGSTNPNTNGSVYEYNDREAGINGSEIAGLTIDGIVTQRQRSPSGSLIAGRGLTARHCEVRDGTKHNLYFRDGGSVQGCLIAGAQFDGASLTLSVYNENTPASLGVTIEDTAYTMPAYLEKAIGGHGHYNTSGDFGTVAYNRCHFDNLGAGVTLGSGGADAFTMTSCHAANVKTLGSFITAAGFTTLTLSSNTLSGGANAQSLVGVVGANTVTLDGNTVRGVGGSGVGIIQCAMTGGTLAITDNDFACSAAVQPTIGLRYGVRLDGGANPTITHTGNTYRGANDSPVFDSFGFYVYSLANPTPRILSDNNTFGDNTRNMYFPEDGFNSNVSTYIGTALNGLSDVDGADGDGSQDGSSTVLT